MLTRVRTVLGAGATFYLGLSLLFGLYCGLGGHNPMEAIYGGAATYVLSIVAAVQFAWLDT